MRGFLKYVFLGCSCVGAMSGFAQPSSGTRIPTATDQVDNDSLNQKDKNGRKQGTWFFHQKALRGEPAYMSFGDYVDNKKEGRWYRLSEAGDLISIKNYRGGLLDGAAQYFRDGRLVCVGNYKSLNPRYDLDSFWVDNPMTGYDTLVIVPTWKGSVKNGTWRYYDPKSGHLISEEIYQYDLLIDKKDFQYTSRSDSLLLQKQIRNLPHNQPPSKKSQRKHQRAFDAFWRSRE